MSKGRTPPIYRPTVNRAGELHIPACDLRCADNRLLIYRGRAPAIDAGGGVPLQLSAWRSEDGLALAASLDRLPHLALSSSRRYLHVSISRADRLPDWPELLAAVEALAGPDIDMAMIKPRRADYVNLHDYCLHFWQLPVEWGVW
jgi:hypothetical protein